MFNTSFVTTERKKKRTLLSASLKTFQVHACDGEELKLECMQNTVISIYLAQYGRSGFNAHHLCPESALDSSRQSSTTVASRDLKTTSRSIALIANTSAAQHQHSNVSKFITNALNANNCLTTEKLRYSLLQKVEAACREQRICKIMTAPTSFGGIDPCPGVRKYAEVAYKCRPNTFSNRIVCENDFLSLKCSKSYRIVIYSASFGATRYGVPECPDTTGAPHSSGDHTPKITEDCQVSYATETVMTACHGKKECKVHSAIDTFGNPGCTGRPRLHLKVVYTCLRKEVLIETLPGLKENGEKDNNFVKSAEEVTDDKVDKSEKEIDRVNGVNGFVDAPAYEPSLSPTVYISESYVKTKDTTSTKAPTISDKSGVNIRPLNEHDLHSNHSHIVSPEQAIGFISNWIYTYKFIAANQERLLLYLLVSICVSLLLFLLFLSFNLFIQKKYVHKKEEKSESLACSPFTGFNDDTIVDDILGELDSRMTVSSVESHKGHSHVHHNHHNHHYHTHHPHHVHHHTVSPEMIRYTSSPFNTASLSRGNRYSSVQRHDSDTHPKAMSGNVNSYF